jgi:parvulin-like peptidyl-prolyl isomerase
MPLLAAWLAALPACQRSERAVLTESSAHAIAVVNNERIAYEDFQNAYQLFLTKWDSFIQNDTGKKQQLRELVLQELIDGKLLDQEARRRGIQVSARPEQVKVRHICVGSRDLYDRVMKSIERGEDFVALVKRYSITPDRTSDGELGYIQRGMLPPELENAIFELKRVGAVSSPRKPVQTQMGLHIFRVEGYRPEGLRTFEDAERDIRAILVGERETEAFQRWMDALRKNATITLDHKLLNAETG